MTLLLDNWLLDTVSPAKIRTCLERSLTDRIFANQTTFWWRFYTQTTNIRILNGHFQNSVLIQRLLIRHHLRILYSAKCHFHLDRPHSALQPPRGWCWPRSAASSPDGSIVTAEPRYSVDAITTFPTCVKALLDVLSVNYWGKVFVDINSALLLKLLPLFCFSRCVGFIMWLLTIIPFS